MICNVKYKYLGNDEVLKDYFRRGYKDVALGIGCLEKGNKREEIYLKHKEIVPAGAVVR